MKAYDFKAWLETKDANQTYNFMDCQGHCLMGQYMASKGEIWDMNLYAEYVRDVLSIRSTKNNDDYLLARSDILQSEPQTFGGALGRLNKVLEDA
jgi:hypothetical protein